MAGTTLLLDRAFGLDQGVGGRMATLVEPALDARVVLCDHTVLSVGAGATLTSTDWREGW